MGHSALVTAITILVDRENLLSPKYIQNIQIDIRRNLYC